MAVSDVFLVKSIVVGAGKLLFRGGASVLAHATPQVAAHAAPEIAAHAAPEVAAHAAPGVTAHAAANVTVHATATVATTGGNAVYHAVVGSRTVYVGITNNLERRAAEHLASKGIVISGIPGLTNLSRAEARAVEQVLIEFHGLGKNGGTLMNKINSIAASNPLYAAALVRGRQLLQQAKYPGF
jgi:filamentous hemagglutinin